MANNCDTTVNIHGSKEDLDTLEKAFNQAFDVKTDNMYEKYWMGRLLLHVGYTMEDINAGRAPRCRGTVTYFERENDGFVINTDTAWVPMLECFRVFADRLLKRKDSVEIVYSAEEPGCGIYFTNDPLKAGTYRVDAYNMEMTPEGCRCLSKTMYEEYVTESRLKTALEKFVGHSGEVDCLICEANEKLDTLTDGKAGFKAHKFEWQEIAR